MSTSSAPGGAAPARFLSATLVATALATSLVAAQTPSTPSQQRPAPFRAGINFVRVDVYPTSNDGRHVGDLTAADFQVLENNVPQKIDTFEHVVIRSGGSVPGAERVDPDSTRTEKQLAADARHRLFVVFLDTGHVSDPIKTSDDVRSDGLPRPSNERVGPPMAITVALTNFLEKTVDPDDLVALMTPDMDAREIVFVRRPTSIEEFLIGAWARRNLPGRANPDEQRLLRCGLSADLLARRREEQAITAARDLVQHLGTLREERKAVILVSEGWMLYKPDMSLAPRTPPGPKGIYVGPDGKPRTGVDPRTASLDLDECGREAARLSRIDDERAFKDLLDEANRANTSFYPVDPRGLAAVNNMSGGRFQAENVPRGKDLGLDSLRDSLKGLASPAQVDAMLQSVTDLAALQVRLESMQTLADNTDGLTLLSNDLGHVLQRIADDTSAYYLLGYSSTNTKADGSFRRITVRVTRPGVSVRARRGYRAATPEELEASRAAATATVEEAALEPVRNAIAAIPAFRDDVPLVAEAGQGCVAATSPGAPMPAVWVAGELTTAGARDPAWQQGGNVEAALADSAGHALGTARSTISSTARAFLIAMPSPPAAGDYGVVVTARPAGASALPVRQSLRLRVNASAGDGLCVGSAALARRGPFTGNAYQVTADARFRRQERVRVEVPVGGAVERFTATLLDRSGKPMAVPVTPGDRQDASGWRWVGGEVVLAPLAPGDYLMQIEIVSGATTQKVLRAFRIIP